MPASPSTPRLAQSRRLGALLGAILVLSGIFPGSLASPSPVAAAPSPNLVISQVYGGGGNSGAPYTHDYIELFNRGTSAVSLAGMSIQYASATGTGNFGASSTQVTELPSATLAPGQYYLVQQAAGAGTGVALPAPDLVDATPIAMSGTAGKVALATGTSSLGCNGGSTPCDVTQLARIIDLVGYGTANFFEGAGAAPTLSNTTAAVRGSNGCTDTDNNASDFSAVAPAPRNTASPLSPCGPLVPVINEFVANHAGTDTHEFIEVRGTPSTDYSAYTVIQIEGDAGGTGVIDSVHPVGTTNAAGYWTTGFLASVLENGTISLLLVRGFTGAAGNDLDTNDDGILDLTPWEAIVDSVAVTDGGASDRTYALPVLAPGFGGGAFTPGGASRIPDGIDTNAVSDWSLNDFDGAGLPGFVGTLVAGEALNTPGAMNVLYTEAAPFVVSTTPAHGAVDVAINATITIEFSEAVDVTGGWFTISCTVSGSHTATVAGGPTTFTLTPAPVFANEETCTVTVIAANVTDQDTQDPPDAMAADYAWSFTTVAAVVDPCGSPFTPIFSIQGSGMSAAITGVVTTQGVVVGDYEGPSPTLRGFYLQDVTGDGDPATSDGIFVFNGSNNSVSLGQVVRVTGTAAEFQDQTQVSSVTSVVDCGVTATVAPVDVTLPFASAGYLERYEGMLVRLPQTLTVTEHFQLGRFGQVVMSSGGRLAQPTNVVTPGAPALALQAANNLNRIIVDDDLNNQNPDPIRFGRGGNPLSASNTLRGGDTATGTIGVMTYTWAGNAASGNAYRVRPVNALNGYVLFQDGNPRPAAPGAVGGDLKVAAFNLLNYFNTFSGCTNGAGGAATDCRGAENLAEFNRQWPKTVAAILGIDADVLGIIEIENDGYGPDSAIQDLVNRLNAATAPGTWAFVDVDAAAGQVNAMGTDAIKVGFLYRPAQVTPVGTTAALNSVEFVNGGDVAPRNRPALAQAFEQNSNGARFVATVNHLKSKGSACETPDAGDGQGNCNAVRTYAAQLLAEWLADDPTGTGDPDVIILGDLNSYAMEDPIAALQAAGYVNLISTFAGPSAYSYVFDGQWGYLDHALASASLADQVTGVVEWHINADEPSVLDYNTNFKSAGQITSLFAPDAFRSSDHDPVVVGLSLKAAPLITSLVLPAAPVQLGSLANLWATFTDGDAGDTHTATIDWGDGFVQVIAGATSPIATSHTYLAAGVYTVTLTVTDSFGLSDSATWEFVVVYDPAGGFVTGGGTTWSPAGALTGAPALEGPASFGFVSKWVKGASVPKGNTTFAFELGGFEFASTSYDWLVVSGPKAIYKGSGTVNGTGSYRFILSAWDGQVQGGGGVDRLRLKVWDALTGEVVYDNQLGAGDDASASTAILSGSIVIHTPRQGKAI